MINDYDQSPGSLLNPNWQVRFLDNTDYLSGSGQIPMVEGITPSAFTFNDP